MSTLSISFTGFDSIQKRIKKAPETIREEVDGELAASAAEIASLAIQDAPGDQGNLKSLIQVEHEGFLRYGVSSNAEYSGYVEFGTGARVEIPAGLEEIANEVRANKLQGSLTAKEAIYAWVRRKGIDPSLSWPIFVSIMVRGIHAHPFFFKQFDLVGPKILERVRKVLDSL